MSIMSPKVKCPSCGKDAIIVPCGSMVLAGCCGEIISPGRNEPREEEPEEEADE